MKAKNKVWHQKKASKKVSQFPQRMTVSQARRLGLLQKSLTTKRTTSSSKYGNQRSFYEGRWYSSRKEAKRAFELDVLFRKGIVKKWEPQVSIKIGLNGVNICSYIADFKVTYPDGRVEYEDVKGFKTDVYKLKKKMVKAFHGIEIKEI